MKTKRIVACCLLALSWLGLGIDSASAHPFGHSRAPKHQTGNAAGKGPRSEFRNLKSGKGKLSKKGLATELLRFLK